MQEKNNEFSGNATGIDGRTVFVDPNGVATVGPAEEPFADRVFGEGHSLMIAGLYFIVLSFVLAGVIALMEVF